MKVFELFKKIKKEEFLRVYPDFMPEEVDFEEQWKLFKEIRKIKPEENIEGQMEVSLIDSVVPKEEKLQTFVCIKKNSERYSTSFTKLGKYLGFEISFNNFSTLKPKAKLSSIRVACALFYDATFYGYSDDEIKSCEKIVFDAYKKVIDKIDKPNKRKVKK